MLKEALVTLQRIGTYTQSMGFFSGTPMANKKNSLFFNNRFKNVQFDHTWGFLVLEHSSTTLYWSIGKEDSSLTGYLEKMDVKDDTMAFQVQDRTASR
jgi:hypothetical protein